MPKFKRTNSKSYDYWNNLERDERRSRYYDKQYNTPCFSFVLLLMGFFCCPCICYSYCNKVDPEDNS